MNEPILICPECHQGILLGKLKGFKESIQLGAQNATSGRCQNCHTEKAYLGAQATPLRGEVPQYPFLEYSFSYKTDHLIGFQYYNAALQVYGEKYTSMKKAHWYQLQGIALRKHIIQVGSIYEDTRVHTLNILKSGKAKNEFKNTDKEIVRKFSQWQDADIRGVVAEPTSSHPEQFIGKMILRKKKVPTGEVTKSGKQKFALVEEWIENRGSFSADLLQKDEAYDLFSSQEDAIRETRAYIRQASDPLGKNEVSKRQVDNLECETLHYCPPVSLQNYMQPRKLKAESVEDGTLRRPLILNVELNFKDRETIYDQRLNSGTNRDEAIQSFYDLLSNTFHKLECGTTWDFTKDAITELKHCHRALLQQGKGHSQKGYNFTFIIDTTLQNWLVKLSCILAGSKGCLTVHKEDVQLAYLDLTEFFHSTLEFVTDKVDGYFDYGGSWKGAKGNEIICLEWLRQHQIVKGSDSKIAVQTFKEKIMEIYECKLATAESHYMRFRKKGWIASKQIGKYDSSVWVTFDSDNPQQDSEGNEDNILYKEIIDDYKNILSKFESLSPLLPSLPIEERVQ